MASVTPASKPAMPPPPRAQMPPLPAKIAGRSSSAAVKVVSSAPVAPPASKPPASKPPASKAPGSNSKGPDGHAPGTNGEKRPAFVVHEALTRAAGDKDLLREAIAILLDDAPQQLKTLREAYSSKDLSTVQRLAHGLQGAVANLGAVNMAAGLRDLSHAARDKRQDAIDPLLDQAYRDWTALERELRTWMANP
jgi:HPt (histidine-containing phosphotransfer) domain-containing protein